MGSFQVQPSLPAARVCDLETTVAGAAAWLDAMLAMPASDAVAPWHDEANRRRLGTVPFDAILSAVDRGRPGLDRRRLIALYQNWIAANERAAPLVYAAWFNLGVLFAQEGNAANAVAAYRTALALQPAMHGAAINLGVLLEADGQPEQALEVWSNAVQPDQARVDLQIQQGRLLETLGRFDEAERILRKVLRTDPAQPDVVHHWIHIRQKICQWPVACPDIPGLPTEAQLQGAGPLGILALTDDIDQQRAAAASWVARKTGPAPRRLAPASPYPHERIRIGYVSSDFCSHAMSYLITELFERHDRGRFEVFGYCASQDDGSALRKRVVSAFDHHRIIRGLSDEQAAQAIRNDEIDVLIDLNGITDGSRLAVLRWRPAPIQATYLGFIGPVPLPELDYLLCDNVVIPPEHKAAYQPKPLPIGRIYQANDSKRTIGRQLSRAEAGLPSQGFVFCCFSKHYKITEEVFSAWMAILRRTDRSVLWLTTDNALSQANMTDAARRAGITEERIIFSERADPDLYMSRLGVADLFLDTFPYNAGTVASDAIRMRLPLVTLCGKAFASRMAASLLHAIEASEGIATSLAGYVGTAVRLANDPVAYAQYKALFTHEAWSGTIGNIDRFTKDFEDVWCRLVQGTRTDAHEPIQAAKDTGTGAAPLRHFSQAGADRAAHLQPPAMSLPPLQLDLQHSLAEAVSHHEAGRTAEAERLYRSILALQPGHALASYSFGLLCSVQGRLQEAVGAYRQAIASQPDLVNAYINLGTVILGLGQREEAVALYRQAIAISPDNAMAHGNLGKALQDLGQIEEAISAYRAGIARQPDNATIHLNLGAALLEQKNWNAAVAVTRRAIALDPQSTMAHANLGTALLNLGHYKDALASCRQAIALGPQGAVAHASLGGAMIGLGALEEGAALCRQAVGLDASLPTAHFNLSHALKASNQLAEAALAARQAIALCPDSAEYHFHLAHILLLQGDLESGWLEYEWRMKLPDFAWVAGLLGDRARPLWAGEDISGKTILVHTEQGFGDIIQFARYLPMVVSQAGRVIVAINSPVRRLLEMIEGITIVSIKEAPLPVFDVQCPLLSLPLVFATRPDSIPATVPYLHVDQAERKRWQRAAGEAPRIGIVWAGNPATKGDRFRSPGLASVARLFSIPGVSFVVLQVGPGREDFDARSWPSNVVDLGKEVADLADTAAIMAGLDLVISSCTAPLHLAGALGTPCWAMIPFAPHFPWLLGRGDTTWYPSMRLYRQEQPGQDWSGVVDRIALDLTVLVQSKLAVQYS